MKVARAGITVGLSALVVLIAAGCEQTFVPIGETDRYFSIYGFLDATADTQWVRVMPVRTSIDTSPEPVNAVVMLEDLGTGKSRQMNGALFSFRTNLSGFGEDLHAFNFWTTERIEPGATYRVTAIRSDGAESRVTIPIPNEVRKVTVQINLWPPAPGNPTGAEPSAALTDSLRIDGPEHLAFVYVHHGSGSTTRVFQRLERLRSPEQRRHVLPISRQGATVDPGLYAVPPASPFCTQGRECRIEIVSSGVPWPFGALLSAAAISHPDLGSNVENGLGFVGGVNFKAIPYEQCRILGRVARGDLCELVYDERSASVEGVVMDPACGGRPLPNLAVTIYEASGDRIRPTRTRGDGSFSIAALEPGVGYRLVVTSQNFLNHEELITLGVGERRIADVSLERFQGSCPA